MQQTLIQVRSQYGEQVCLVFQQFPLPDFHPEAFKAAEASLCAHEQGSFWRLHDSMFEGQGNFSVAEIKGKARKIGLDQDALEVCLDSGMYVEKVQAESSRGRPAGVTGAPALFVNGIPVKGGRTGIRGSDRGDRQGVGKNRRVINLHPLVGPSAHRASLVREVGIVAGSTFEQSQPSRVGQGQPRMPSPKWIRRRQVPPLSTSIRPFHRPGRRRWLSRGRQGCRYGSRCWAVCRWGLRRGRD